MKKKKRKYSAPRKMGVCHECGIPGEICKKESDFKKWDLIIFKGRKLCRECFIGDDDDLCIENFAEMSSPGFGEFPVAPLLSMSDRDEINDACERFRSNRKFRFGPQDKGGVR